MLNLLIALLFATATALSNDFQVLSELYNKTNGSLWINNTNWLSHDKHVCEWYGVICYESSDIYYINLPENNLSGIIPASLNKLDELEILNINHNKIFGFSDEFANFEKLQVIIANNNVITQLSSNFLANTSLMRALYLDHNQIQNLDFESKLFNNLDKLTLNNNKLSTITFNSNNYDLNDLYLSYNNIVNISGTPRGKIETFYINNNNLNSLPENFGNYIDIREMDLSYNNLTYLPNKFGTWFKDMQYLYLHNNNLKSLPDSLCFLNKLQVITLNNNNLKSLPNSFGFLNKLKKITLNNNNLESLPVSMANLTLQIFNIENNMLTKLPSVQTKYFYASKNQISSLFFDTLRGSHYLDVSQNQINSIHGQSDSLINLNISHNKIIDNMRDVYLKHVVMLDMSNNLIENYLWQWDIGTPEIIYFSLENNNLHKFLFAIPAPDCPDLKILNLHNNSQLKIYTGEPIDWHQTFFHQDSNIITVMDQMKCTMPISNRGVNDEGIYFGIGAQLFIDPSALNYTHCYKN